MENRENVLDMLGEIPETSKAFCCRRGRCPELHVTESGKVVLGGREEGFTVWTKGNLRDFISSCKSGEFDDVIR